MNLHSDTDLLGIAICQKRILWLVVASIALLIPVSSSAGETTGLLAVPAQLLIGIIGAVLIYRLAKALKDPAPWLFVILAFVPYVNVAILLLINVRASAVLKANNIEVSLMGVPQFKIQDLRTQKPKP